MSYLFWFNTRYGLRWEACFPLAHFKMQVSVSSAFLVSSRVSVEAIARGVSADAVPGHPDWQNIARDVTKRARAHFALQAIIKNNSLLFEGRHSEHSSNLKPVQFISCPVVINGGGGTVPNGSTCCRLTGSVVTNKDRKVTTRCHLQKNIRDALLMRELVFCLYSNVIILGGGQSYRV